MDGFERFTKSGKKGFSPRVSITSTSLIGFNQGAMRRYSIQKYSHVVLFFNKENKRVGIQFTSNANEEGARRMRQRPKGGADVSAKAFLDYFAIDHKKTKRYTPTYNEKLSMLIIDLNEAKTQEPEEESKQQNNGSLANEGGDVFEEI